MANPVITIDFQAQLARLELEAKKGSRAIRQMAGDMESALGTAKAAVFGLLGALGAHSFASAIKGAAEAADSAAKMGDRFGVATQSMIGLHAAGELAGATSEQLGMAMKTLAQRTTEAIQKGGDAAQTFRQLKLDAGELAKLPLDQQLIRVTEALGRVENANLRNTLANEVFGKSYGDVMGLVTDGAAAIRQASEDAAAFGLAISRVDAAKLEAANDALTRAQQAMRGVFTTIALNLSHVVKAVADGFADGVRDANGFRNEVATGMQHVSTAVSAAAWFIERMRFAWVAAKLVVAEFIDTAIQGLYKLNSTMTGSRLIALMQYLPGPAGAAARAFRAMSEDSKTSLENLAGASTNTLEDIKQELEDLASNAKTFDQWEKQVKAAFARAAAAIEREARAKAARAEQLGNSGIGIEKPDEARKDTWAADLSKRVERIRTENMTALAAEMEGFAQRRDELNLARAQDLIDEDFYNSQSAALKDAHERKLTEIEDAETRKRYGISNVYRRLDLQSASFALAALERLMQTKSRAMFNIGKFAAVSRIAVDTIVAARGAYAALSNIPIIGPGLGAAAYAAIMIAGAADAMRVRSMSFGGGAAAAPVFNANPVTGSPAPGPVAPFTAPGSGASPIEIHVNVFGNVIGGGGMAQIVEDEVVPALSDLINNRDIVVIGPNSRQAANLQAA